MTARHLVLEDNRIAMMEGGYFGLMDLLGGPAPYVAATVQEDFEQADDARIIELDAG